VKTNPSVLKRTAIRTTQHINCLSPDHRTKREVDSTYQQVARSSLEEPIEGAETTERKTEGLSESNLKQGVATGLKGAHFISLTLRLLMIYIYGAPILDVSRSHTTTHHSR